MEKNSFDKTVQSLFEGADQVLSTKTVVGEPQIIGDTIILPLVDVSFGMGAGTFGKEKSENGAGGIGGKMTPSAILIIRKGETRLVNVRNRDAITQALDLLPDAINHVTSLISNQGRHEPEVETALKKAKIPEETVREEIKN